MKEIEIVGRAVDWREDYQGDRPPARVKSQPLDLCAACRRRKSETRNERLARREGPK